MEYSQREYPSYAMVGVGVLVRQDNRVLLTQRRREPDLGLWTLPGGLVELGEGIREAAKRETKEETGLDVELERLLGVVDKIVYDDDGRIRYHYALIDFLGYPVGGEFKLCSSELLAAQWISLDDIHRYPLPVELRNFINEFAI
jgi:8-oxo-dGTP diphosphatase